MIRSLAILAAAFPMLLNAGEPRFVDQSATLPGTHIYGGDWEFYVGGGTAVFDCNGDDRPDIFAAGGQNPASLWVNQIGLDGWAFSRGPIEPITGVSGAYPLDVDGDGIIDLMLLRVGENRLLRGTGDCRFEDFDSALEFTSDNRWSTAFSATWEGGNQLPTMAIGNYVDRSDPEGPFEACDENQLYRPNGKTYMPAKPLTPGYCALSMLFSDWQGSGQAGLRVSNDRHYYVRGGSEQMWDIEQLRLLGPEDGWTLISIWGMGIASQDITGDRRPDVVLTSMGDQLMQIATPDGYQAAPFGIGTYAHRPFIGDDGRPSTGWHAEFGDVDNDGLADLFIAKGNVDQMPGSAMKDPNNLLMQSADGTFREVADVAGVATLERSRGAALADFDRDGLLDLVVVNRRAPIELYRNVSAATGNWVGVTLHQKAVNAFAIGSWIELRKTNETIVVKELTIGGGHAGGQLGPVHFGLGKADAAEIRVIWPDGVASDWVDIPGNQYLDVWRDGTKLSLSDN